MGKKKPPASKPNESQPPNPSSAAWYKIVWRWHFYAGIIFAPFLIILAITGSVYLFKPQIEQALYRDYYTVTPQVERVTPSKLVGQVKELYPDATITKYRPGESDSRSTEISLTSGGESMTVFMDPYTGEKIGELKDKDRIMDKIEEFHGELMVGTVGDRIVELAACWAIVLIITGVYLWFPKNKNKNKGKKKRSFAGILYPRLGKGKQILRRDLHAVPAFWIAAGMLFLIMTGLPWSGLWGSNFQTMATNTGAGYPPSIWSGSAPSSHVMQTKEVAEVPWAAENLAVPNSTISDFTPLPIEDVMYVARSEGIHPSYTISIPQQADGVYTLSAYPPKAQDEATMHIDQYSGAVLADYRYDHYGIVGKAVALGITLHKGTQFGIVNQIFSFLICIGIIFIAVSGLYLWWKRKPDHGLGAPKAPEVDAKKMRLFLLLLIALGILFPLVGLSLIIVWIIDYVIVRRVPAIKTFLNA
ncbi:PepSY domain-containing protein [Paenibacillus lautus]|uniref:PepSY-associated TM helix domain-containing protein n=1 Tax=Paenibacillus lautus TaxID=1401 RepID=UPI003D2B0344